MKSPSEVQRIQQDLGITNLMWAMASSNHRRFTRVCPKVSGWIDNETNNNNKLSLRSNTEGYGGKTHQTDSQNSDTTAPSGRELYNLQFSLQAASPENFGHTLVQLASFALSPQLPNDVS
jgi:hypothetical protein